MVLLQVLGELHMSVCHQPLSSKLSVTVLEARNLPKISSLNIGGNLIYCKMKSGVSPSKLSHICPHNVYRISVIANQIKQGFKSPWSQSEECQMCRGISVSVPAFSPANHVVNVPVCEHFQCKTLLDCLSLRWAEKLWRVKGLIICTSALAFRLGLDLDCKPVHNLAPDCRAVQCSSPKRIWAQLQKTQCWA